MKRCTICKEPAKFRIRNNSDYYCEECAVENFNDVGLLEKVEEEAQRLKEYIKQKLQDES